MKSKLIMPFIVVLSFLAGMFLGASLFQKEPKPERCNSGIYYELINDTMYQSYLPELDTCNK